MSLLLWRRVVVIGSIGAIILAYVISMESGPIYITIDYDEYRAKYLDVLREAGIAYRISKSGEIIIGGISTQELSMKTKSYDEFVEEDIKKQNRERLTR